MDSIFKNKTKEEKISVTDLKILIVLVIGLLRQDFNKLVNRIELVKL
jgi:hypothetical protein